MTLVSVDEVRKYGGVEATADTEQLTRLIVSVEAAFLRQVNREDRPFGPAEMGRIEVVDGTGTGELYLAYPVKALTIPITLGYASPWDDSVAVTDPAVIQVVVGSRRLVRRDGGTFGPLGRSGYVVVTYDTDGDEPEDVKLAVIRRVAALYRESGTEEATSERTLEDTADLPRVADLDPLWREAVAAHWEARI